MSSVSTVTQIESKKYYPITSENFEEVCKDDQKLKIIFETFAKHRPHTFMKDYPQLCCDLIKPLSDQVTKGNITRDCAVRVTHYFATNKVFSQAEFEESIEILCKDSKKIKINENILKLNSEYFSKMFSHNLRENNEKCIDYSKFYSEETMLLAKTFMYQGAEAFHEALLRVKNNSTFAELIDFVNIAETKVLRNCFISRFSMISQKIVTSEQDLRELASNTSDKTFCKIVLSNYLEKEKIAYRVAPLSLSSSTLSVLGSQGIVGELARKCVEGILLDKNTDLDDLELLELLPEDIRGLIKNLVIDAPLAKILKQAFPIITRLFVNIDYHVCSANYVTYEVENQKFLKISIKDLLYVAEPWKAHPTAFVVVNDTPILPLRIVIDHARELGTTYKFTYLSPGTKILYLKTTVSPTHILESPSLAKFQMEEESIHPDHSLHGPNMTGCIRIVQAKEPPPPLRDPSTKFVVMYNNS